jgi:protoporphyrinogen oxidase
LGATIFYASRIKDWKSLEKILVADWLERWSGRRTLHKIWLPLLRAKLGDNYRETSAAFIWAIIARMYAARRSGMKREVFGYMPGGYARVIERFGQFLRHENVRCKLGHRVEHVHSTESKQVRLQLADGTSETFDHAVLTVAAPLAASMCEQLTSPEKNALNQLKYQGIVCASVLLKEPLSEFYITNITDDWVPFTAVIDMSAFVDRKYFGGGGFVYLPKYLPSNAHEFELTDKQFQDSFLAAVERMYPKFKREDVLCFCVSRVKYLLPISTLGYSDRLPAMFTSVPGLYLVSSAHIVNGTLNVNETVQLAESTAAQLANLSVDKVPEMTSAHDIREFHGQPIAGCRQ